MTLIIKKQLIKYNIEIVKILSHQLMYFHLKTKFQPNEAFLCSKMTAQLLSS